MQIQSHIELEDIILDQRKENYVICKNKLEAARQGPSEVADAKDKILVKKEKVLKSLEECNKETVIRKNKLS